jgi:DNA mismatch endonuclease (patch repair protein)
MPAPKNPLRYQEWRNKVVAVLLANASKGGRAGKGKSKPWVSKKMKELWQTDEYRAKVLSSRRGKMAGDRNPSKRAEVKVKIREDRKRWWNYLKSNPDAYKEYIEKVKAGLKKAREEGRMKRNPLIYSEVAKRRWQNPQYRKKQSDTHKGEMNPSKRHEVRRKISIARIRDIAEGRYPVTNTKLEQKVEEVLKRLGIDYEKQYPLEGHVYDFAIPSMKILINVNGCYWHGCSKCYNIRKLDKVQKRTRLYDYLRRCNARKHGWHLIEIWEHDINSSDVLGRILARIP